MTLPLGLESCPVGGICMVDPDSIAGMWLILSYLDSSLPMASELPKGPVLMEDEM